MHALARRVVRGVGAGTYHDERGALPGDDRGADVDLDPGSRAHPPQDAEGRSARAGRIRPGQGRLSPPGRGGGDTAAVDAAAGDPES